MEVGENEATVVEMEENEGSRSAVNPGPPYGKSSAGGRRGSDMGNELEKEDFLRLLHGSDPVKIELSRLENEIREKNRALVESQSEIKALKLMARAKEKELSKVAEERQKIFEKFRATETTVRNKNIEMKRINEEKKTAIAAQVAAEATLRRVHAAQKEEEMPPLEATLAPLEAEIKVLRQEVTKLQDDNKALGRLTRSKEAALLEAERQVDLAKVKAALVDDLLNRNQELVKQNEICQEEYKIIDKMHRQKVAEVEKLGQTVRELEEALLSGASAANAVRDYQRQVNELKGEKKTLERTLSRAKVTENRVAVVTANEWKDTNDKVMPVKRWLEERRFLMGEMQQLRDKLSTVERTAKAEAQLKEKFQMRLKVVEGSLKSSMLHHNGSSKFTSLSGHGMSTNGISSKKFVPPVIRSSSSPRNSNSTLKFTKRVSRSFDAGSVSAGYRTESFQDSTNYKTSTNEADDPCVNDLSIKREVTNGKISKPTEDSGDDLVPGVLHDLLQKEVVALRKACHEKDQELKDKDASIKVLTRKVDTLTKAVEVKAKKIQREKSAMAKEMATVHSEKGKEQKASHLKKFPSNLS